VGDSGGYRLTPALINNSLFAASQNGTISHLDAKTGALLWKVDAGNPITAGVGTDGDTIVVGTEKGGVLAFNTQGVLRWRAQVSSEILSSPAVGQGLVIVRSLDNRIFAFDAQTGQRRWAVQRTAPSLILRTSPGILITSTTAYLAMPGGRLLALSLKDGSTRWEAIVATGRGSTELERLVDVSGMPVIQNDDICVTSYQGKLACYEPITGNLKWSIAFSSDVGPALDENAIFVSDENGYVSAVSRKNGIIAWQNTQLAYRKLSTPVSSSKTIAVGDGLGYIHFLSKENGSFVARVRIDDSPIVSIPVTFGNTLIFQTQAGTLSSYNLE
jgi:outer membrane protein assembly factor BamB